MKRLKVLDDIGDQWKNCRLCPLHKQRRRVVNWRGNPSAKLTVIGEAPGYDEDRQGRPFVGTAGRMLDKLFEEAGLNSAEDAFIINRIGCRPPNQRHPTREEFSACSRRFHELLLSTNPKALLLLGSSARLAKAQSARGARGAQLKVDLVIDRKPYSWPAVVTYHPSALIHTDDPNDVRRAVADLKWAYQLAQRTLPPSNSSSASIPIYTKRNYHGIR